MYNNPQGSCQNKSKFDYFHLSMEGIEGNMYKGIETILTQEDL